MRVNNLGSILITGCLIFLNFQLVFCNDYPEQWAIGEVISIDAETGSFTLSYFDYEFNREEEVSVIIDDQTIFENANSFSDINIGSTLSVDYATDESGRNIADYVTLEDFKLDEMG